jgi:hypothetical protein
MEFKEIQFKDSNAQRVYNNYIINIKNVIKPLSEKDSQEILMEFNSHIYESLQSNNNESELKSLLNSIDKLGAPEEVLKPLLADKLLEKATKSFNPIHVFQALAHNITNGVGFIIFSILYLCLGGFLFLIFAKIINGKKVGLFLENGDFKLLGLATDSSNYQEVLGNWFIPIMILAIVIVYFIITLLLKLKKNVNKK